MEIYKTINEALDGKTISELQFIKNTLCGPSNICMFDRTYRHLNRQKFCEEIDRRLFNGLFEDVISD